MKSQRSSVFIHWASAQVTGDVDGRPWTIHAWGGSDRDVDEARKRALARAQAGLLRAQGGDKLGGYEYARQSIKEELLEEVQYGSDTGSQLAGIVTRNRYGARILNAHQALFADVDVPLPRRGLQKLIAKLRRRPPGPTRSEALARIDQVIRERPELGLRVYETAAGFRCLATGQVFTADSIEAQELLESLGSDPLYVLLCRSQGTFRARLTPKPWRCGSPNPPVKFPFQDAAEERAQRSWETAYQKKITQYSVCRLVRGLEHRPESADLKSILELHDGEVLGDHPLA